MVMDTQRVGQANSVGPICSSRWDRNVTKRKQSVCIAISVGPIAHLGWTKTLQRETERLQSHLSETEIPIGETELLGFVAMAMTYETRWRRIERIGRAELDFWFGSYVDVRR